MNDEKQTKNATQTHNIKTAPEATENIDVGNDAD